MLRKCMFLCGLIFFLFIPTIALTAVTGPCAIVAYASGNSYLQSPSFTQYMGFAGGTVSFTNCASATTVTIIVANPPQNPPPNNAPVYIALAPSAGGTPSTQVLLVQGSQTVINAASGNFDWFTGSTWAGVIITSPSTPWVPGSVTVIWQRQTSIP